jgi:photosystem II stability/assembly factor-like uncharacterized protein
VTGRGPSPRWRRWALLSALLLIGVVAVAFGILELPSAPVAPAVTPIPNTVAGRLVEQIEMVRYPTAQVGWGVVPTNVYWRLVRTTDAGERWTDVTPPGNATNGGIAVTVTGPSTAIVTFIAYQYLRASTFAITTDGGAQWTAGILPNAVSEGPDPMFALTASRLWAVLANGEVLASTNGGTSWAAVTLPGLPSGSCLPTSIWFTSSTNGWVTGECQGVAAMWRSADAGGTWQPVVLSTAYVSSASVSVAPPQAPASGPVLTSAVESGSGPGSLRVFQQSSTGWTSAPAVALPAGRVLISFTSATDGWALVAPRAPGALVLAYQTSNAGVNWSFQTTTIPAAEVTAFDLLSPESAVALTQAGRQNDLYRSTNGGRTWGESEMAVSEGPVPKVNGIAG